MSRAGPLMGSFEVSRSGPLMGGFEVSRSGPLMGVLRRHGLVR